MLCNGTCGSRRGCGTVLCRWFRLGGEVDAKQNQTIPRSKAQKARNTPILCYAVAKKSLKIVPVWVASGALLDPPSGGASKR
jgi:hypothetical protein